MAIVASACESVVDANHDSPVGAVQGAAVLSHFDLFDQPVASASMEEDAEESAAVCAPRVRGAYGALITKYLRSYVACTRGAGSEPREAGVAELCLGRLAGEGSAKVAARRLRLGRAARSGCRNTVSAPATPESLAAVLETGAVCAACRVLERLHGMAGQCDRIDDGLENGTCGLALSGECGDGKLDAGEECDDGNTLSGDCCPPGCRFEEVASETTCDEPNCTQRCCQGAGTCGRGDECTWSFADVSAAAGIDISFSYDSRAMDARQLDRAVTAGGVAVGDFDDDGWVDLFAVGGPGGHDTLLRNRGDGVFEDVSVDAGVRDTPSFGSGPLFADYDGDGHLDLIIGGVNGTPVRVLRNLGDGSFVDATLASQLEVQGDTFSLAGGDFDNDGDLDLALAQWGQPMASTSRLWRNLGDGTFSEATDEAGLRVPRQGPVAFTFDWAFTPNFADIDDDGSVDLLLTADFGTSQVFLNRGDGTFEDRTDADVIDDQNGMGAALADIDHDGDLDWFVSSIWDPTGDPAGNWGATGNRLYRNLGDGRFEDATGQAGVRRGFWGWGSCFADFNLDGWIDLFHANGFPTERSPQFGQDASRLFLGQADGSFVERSTELGLVDVGQGRGVACFDYDNDGDIDIYVANNGQHGVLWANGAEDLGRHFVNVRLRGTLPNSRGIGAEVTVAANGRTQLQAIAAGSNFASQNPATAHFGLDRASVIDELIVRWPDGTQQSFRDVEADRTLLVVHPEAASSR